MIGVAASVAAAALALAGCSTQPSGPTAAPTSSGGTEGGYDPALVSAAQAEGALTIYSAASDAVNTAILDAFGKQFGIQAQAVHLATNDLLTRFLTEAEAGAPGADDVIFPQPQFFSDNQALFVPLTPEEFPNLAEWPADGIDNNTSVIVTTMPYGVLYNTTLVPKEDVPKTWTDLSNATKYKNQVAFIDPGADSAYLGLSNELQKVNGIDILKRLAALNPTYGSNSTPEVQAVAAGTAAMGMPLFASQAAGVKSQGAPVDFQILTGPTLGLDSELALVKNAPHPNAAKLFFEWLASSDGIGAICNAAPYASPLDPEGDLGCLVLPGDLKIIDQNVSESQRQMLLQAWGRS